ncbi:MAG: DUF4351 domain-containing protein [Candidatus Tectomicrobia bacterium]|uniref:DUF4351 domain-containing protein n=1 Tax=Tectimicrobiota bacterium TaxID=2528274 RepID=A0A932CM05_UNCTE|nr:DUF4351 domain-containing protein [Candidatus Tectomicrobia bacterium]
MAHVVLEAVRERLRREEIEKMGKTIAESLIEEGKELGKELGLQQGILQAKQEDILRLLRAKFGPLPPAIEEQIEALRDVNRLDALLEKILTVRSLEEMGIA